MTLKIICNPYTKKIDYKYKSGDKWEKLDSENPLLKYDGKEFSYIATEVVKSIYEQDYGHVIFEGSPDDYEELEYAVKSVLKLDKKFDGKELIICERSNKQFRKASEVLESIEKEFDGLLDIISKKYSGQNEEIKKEIKKFKETVVNEIPIVIMGTYSSGKSAFINALIGSEILPSATTTTTAKTHRIRKSSSSKTGKISFLYDGNKVLIEFKESDVKVETSAESDFCNNLHTLITENSKDSSIESHIYQALKQLNEHDISDSRTENKKSHLSDLIEIEVPSRNGIFSDGKYSFSVLDTPGSDSADKGTDKTHFEILKNALNNQTNGLPIFVTESEKMNSAGNKEILEEMKKINLDKNNMIIIANRADLTSDEGIKKLLTESDVIREWQSTRIYFVSSIAGIAGQKRNNIDFYNEEYGYSYRKCKDDFIIKDSPYYRELYAFNIMPDSQKNRITIKCQRAVESGNEKKMLFANSGIQCVVEEVFAYGEKHALYNKCANAKNYLVNAINIVQKEISQKIADLEAPAEEITKKLDEKKKNLISQLKSTSSDLSSQVISQYPNMLSSKKDDKLEDKKAKIGKDWIEHYEDKFQKELKNRGVDTLVSLQKVGKKFGGFPEEYDRAKKVLVKTNSEIENEPLNKIIGIGKKILNTSKRGLEAAGKTIGNVVEEAVSVAKEHHDGMREVRCQVKKAVEDSLLEDIKDIDGCLYAESRDFFKRQERFVRDSLIAFAMNKESDELTNDEKEKLKGLIESFPSLREIGEDAVLLQDAKINHYLIGSFIDLGGINYKKLAEESKVILDKTVSDQISMIQDDFEKEFRSWSEKLISSIENEITTLNPDLVDWSKEKLRLENDINDLKNIESTMTDSEKMLDKLLLGEGEENE